MAAAAEAFERITRVMAETATKKTRPLVDRSASAAAHPEKTRFSTRVRSRRLLTWDASLVPNGVALVWDADLLARPSSTGRDLGIRLTWAQ
jgi:hypothetical protein